MEKQYLSIIATVAIKNKKQQKQQQKTTWLVFVDLVVYSLLFT